MIMKVYAHLDKTKARDPEKSTTSSGNQIGRKVRFPCLPPRWGILEVGKVGETSLWRQNEHKFVLVCNIKKPANLDNQSICGHGRGDKI